MVQDGPGGGTGGGPLDGGTGGVLIYDGDAWDLVYDGYGGFTGGTGGGGGTAGSGGAPLCLECFPFPAHCLDGTVYYQFSFGSACPPEQCTSPTIPCALGCIDEELTVPSYAEKDQTPFLCEDAAVRGPGFPCRADIDCVTPIGALFDSNLTDPAAGLGGAGPNSDSLSCAEEGFCVPGLPSAVPDMGDACESVASAAYVGPALGFDASCTSGACLVGDGGQSVGTCTTSCETYDDCPAGYSCAEAIDNRRTIWGPLDYSLSPTRLLVCVPD